MNQKDDLKIFTVQLNSVLSNITLRRYLAEQLAHKLDKDIGKMFQFVSKAHQDIARGLTREEAEEVAEICRKAGLEASIIEVRPIFQRAIEIENQLPPEISRGRDYSSPVRGPRMGGLLSQGFESPYVTMLFCPRKTVRDLLNGPYKNCNLSPLVFVHTHFLCLRYSSTFRHLYLQRYMQRVNICQK
ncbi:MAG: hypothetical protein AAF708_11245 [Deinococcota bacterium]